MYSQQTREYEYYDCILTQVFSKPLTDNSDSKRVSSENRHLAPKRDGSLTTYQLQKLFRKDKM
jgi:hypothetical protein